MLVERGVGRWKKSERGSGEGQRARKRRRRGGRRLGEREEKNERMIGDLVSLDEPLSD